MRRVKTKSLCRIDHLELRRLLSTTIFVSGAATGGNDGISWTNAYTDLQSALTAANTDTSNNQGPVTIEVGQGTYKPSSPSGRGATFELIDDVSIEGGFAGPADQNAAQNPVAYPTILSGDIDGDGTSANNSYHVVTADYTDSTAVLDGFTITGGNADATFPDENGGGIRNNQGGATISNCIITGNTASFGGGGVYNFGSSMMLNDCTISGNTAGTSGGGLYDHYSTVSLTDCTITQNSSSSNGGGILSNHDTSDTLTDCIITGNTATFHGGGVADYYSSNSSSQTLTNCVIAGNRAGQNGGGISMAGASQTLVNCTISGNTAGSNGDGMYNYNNSTPTIINSIIWDNTGRNEIDSDGSSSVIITYSDIDQSGFAGLNHNIDADPLFVNSGGGDFRLEPTSPGVDAGLNSAIAGTNTDLDGAPRISNRTVDLGAYEFLPTIFVDASATGANNGGSWADAFTTLTSALALAFAGSGQTINVAQGTYTPTAGTDRAASFQLLSDVNLYGGFAGDTTANPGQRDVALFPTILCGDIGKQGDNTDNSYNVVTGSGTDNTAVLDGFTITGGNSGDMFDGGGILNVYGSPSTSHCTITGNTAHVGGGIYDGHSSPILYDCVISQNAANSGGGIENEYYSSPAITDCTITENTATGNVGGGIDNFASSSPTLTDCSITENQAVNGGGVSVNSGDCSPVLTDCIISGNTASDQGGGIYNHGDVSLVNCVITGNTAQTSGGGIYNNGDASIALTNCTVSGNNGGLLGGAIDNTVSSSATLSNSILWGDTAANSNEIYDDSASSATVTFSDVQGGFTGTGNINSDPMFVRAVGTNGPTDFGDLRILDSSPAVNAGSKAAIPNGVTTDVAGNSRIIANTVDMGAYEALLAHLVFDVSPPANSTAGTSFGFEVDVEDGNGQDILGDNSSITVQISSGPAGATLHGTLTLAAHDGEAVFSGVNITQAGSYTISASNGLLPVATSNSFTINPAAAGSLSISQQPVSTTAGQDIPLAVRVEDSFGNLVDGTSVIVAIAAGGSAGTLNGTTTLATTGGVANFSDLTIDQFGTYSFIITDGSLPAVISPGFVISAAAAAKLVFIIPPTNTVAGQTMTGFAVEIEDQFGNLELNDTSSVSLTSTPAGITASVAANHGIAEFTNVSSTVAGQYSFSAADDALTGTNSTTFNINPAAPAQLIISQQPGNAVAGVALSPITVQVEDQFGNLADGSGVTVAIASGTTGAILGGTLTLPTFGGIATFNNLTLDRAGSFTLAATDGSLPSETTNSFTITFSGPTLVFATAPTDVTAGAKTLSFKVTAENADGSTITSSKAKIKVTLSSGGKLLGTSTVAVKNGIATFSKLSIQKAGTYTLTASSAGLASTASSTFTITAGAASKMLFNPQPASATHGVPFNVDVALTDKYGNLAASDTSTVSLILGTHPKTAAALSISQGVSDGLAEFDNVIIDTAGTYTLKASDGKLKATSKKFAVS